MLWVLPVVLPLIWAIQAGRLALGRRTGDLVSHVWAIWNGTLGDPTRSVMASAPTGTDLLVVYGGWLHTLIGTLLARLGVAPEQAYTWTLAALLAGTGYGALVLARTLGAGPLGAATAGLLFQLDGWVLYNATDGRPEHAGFGPLALALAGALACWTGRGGRWTPIWTGLAGALVFVASWEQALWLFCAMAWLLPWLLWHGRAPHALRRWGVALGVSVVAAGPWILTFLVRSLAWRELDEGSHAIAMARDQALELGIWTIGIGGQPTRLAVVALLLLPLWLAPATRRLWLGVVLGLGLCLVFALGPAPGFWTPGDLGWSWAPYSALQQLPLVGWFHSPARIAMGLPLASAVGAGLLVHHLGGGWRGRVVGPVISGLIVASALAEARQAELWPRGGFQVPHHAHLRALGEVPGAGAVLDLPAQDSGLWTQEIQLRQLAHRRPVPGHAWLAHLAPDHTPVAQQQVPLLAWITGLIGGEAPPLDDDQQTALARFQIRFLAVDLSQLPKSRAPNVDAVLTERFGEPVARRGARWAAWDLFPEGLPDVAPYTLADLAQGAPPTQTR